MPIIKDANRLEADRKALVEKERHKAELAEVKRHRCRVYSFHEDGEFVSVEYLQENGERVIANYHRRGWNKAPAAIVADTMRRLANPPRTVLKAQPPRPGGLPRS